MGVTIESDRFFKVASRYVIRKFDFFSLEHKGVLEGNRSRFY